MKNSGKLTHGLAISGPGVKPRRHAAHQARQVGDAAVTLKSGGKYTIWCPVPGHAAQGHEDIAHRHR